MKEDSVKLMFVPMPRGVKDINTFHCTTCHKDTELFKQEFKKLQPIPTTLEGFKLLVESGLTVITEYVVNNYIRNVIGNDKIEIDRFIQALYNLQGKNLGITKTTIKDVAKSAILYMAQEAEEANEMLAANLGADLISKGDDCYTYQRITTQGIVLEPFTSFIVKVLRREQLDNGEVVSIWKLTNNTGKTQEIEIGAIERSSSIEFSKKVNAVDGFMYRVPAISGFHTMFMYYIEKDLTVPIVRRCKTVGKSVEDGVWLFDTYGIDKEGNIVYEENGTYNLNGINYVPPQVSMTRDLYKNKVYMAAPAMINKEEVLSFLRNIEINQGSKMPWILLGWIGACFAKDIIQDSGYGFPVCYLTGNAQSGKTTLAKWLLAAAGYRNTTALGARSSAFGINVMSSVYGNLPLWFDDIRSLGEEGIWNSIILGAYENATDLKGSISGELRGTLEYKCGMLITSEFFIKSPAAQSRCLELVCDEVIQDRSLFKELDKASLRVLPYIGARAIEKIQKKEVDFMGIVEETKDRLINVGINSRFSANYAVVLAGFSAMFGDYIENTDEIWQEFVRFMVEFAGGNNNEVNKTSYAQELVKELAEILTNEQYKDLFRYNDAWVIRENHWILRTNGLYELWRRYKGLNNTGDYNSKREFVAQLRRLPYAIRNTAGTASINGKNYTVINFDLEKMENDIDEEIRIIPDLLRDLDISEFI